MDFQKSVEHAAERYVAEGYRVIVRPANGELPAFAQGLNIDFLAMKDGEQVLVQVKENREDLRHASDSLRAAEVINAQPGWRFDLVVLNADSPEEKLAHDMQEPSMDDILEDLARAERSIGAGDYATSFIVAWASLEAAMRRAVRTAGIDLQNISPGFLIRTLYANGLLERAEFDQLDRCLPLRNALVHGLAAPRIDAEISGYVVNAAKRLLAQAGQEEASR